MLLKVIVTLSLSHLLNAQDIPNDRRSSSRISAESRDPKLLPVFQVVRFPNDKCTGSTRNGTCYTSAECSSRGGTNDGSCASGFGVCCLFSMACGTTSSENNTYFVKTSFTSLTSPCVYTICPSNSKICRIRLDFTGFVLTGPGTGSASRITALTFGSIGKCATDTFSVTAPGGFGSPVICGTNTGYHMILDAHSDCHKAAFDIGGSSATTRSWDIRVTQYACGDEISSGPPGCLQYYTATANTIQNFGFDPTITTVTSTITHLANQHYDICIRRGLNFCYICYSPTIIPGTGAVITQASYGLAISAAAAIAQSATGSYCTADWIEIPFANTAAIAATTHTKADNSRFCGRFLALTDGATASLTICSRSLPFRVGVNFDENEYGAANAADMATLNEENLFPAGIIGFKITYWQVAC